MSCFILFYSQASSWIHMPYSLGAKESGFFVQKNIKNVGNINIEHGALTEEI